MPLTPQPLHIFRKDVTHLWPETLVVVALFVAFAAAAPSRWTGSEYVVVSTLLALFLKVFLMPISWLVVISRLIHDEPLVGDRQFWTSRPYHWASLLAAKVLYIVAFLYVPFLLMQVYLLKHAGLYPTTVIPELLHNLLLLTVVIVVPIAAISAVTSTFPRVLLSFIGAVIYLLVVGLVVVWLILRRMPPPSLEPIIVGLFIVLPLIALVYQYATRKTATSRAILLATPIVIALVLLLTPTTALIRHAYPIATTPSLTALPEGLGPKQPQAGNLIVQHGDVQVGILVKVDGTDKDSNYLIDGVSATVTGPGVSWTSPYITQVNGAINAGQQITAIPVVMPLAVFNQVSRSPADVHLSVAVQQLKGDPPATWKSSATPFSVPGHGICSYSSERTDDVPVCRYPFQLPKVNYVTAPLVPSCGVPNAPKTQGVLNMSRTVSLLDFDPVVVQPLALQNRSQQPQPNQPPPGVLCPGTPLVFIEAHNQAKNRIEVDEKNLLLVNYATHHPDKMQGEPAPGAAAGQPQLQ